MRVDDGLIGLVLMVFAAVVIVYAQTFPALAGMAFGPALFPTAIGSGLALCGAAMIVQSALARRRARAREPWIVLEDWARDRRAWSNAALVVLVILFFGVALDRLGYHLAAFTSLVVLLFWLRVRPRVALATAVGVTALTHELFNGWLRVPLPWGLLEPVAW